MSALPKASIRDRDELDRRLLRAREALLRNAVTVDREGRFPIANFDVLHHLELLGLAVPTQHGGWGLGPAGDFEAYGRVITQLASACSSTGQCLSVHLGAATTIGALGTPAQQRRFYGEMLAGALFASAGSEQGQRRTAGGNAVRRGTLLEREGDGYRLNGRKFFCTNSAAADWLVVFAVHPLDGVDHTVNVLVHRDDEGVVIHDSWDAFGQRGTASGEVELNDVRLDADRLLGESAFAFERAPLLPATYQIGFALQLHAIAEGALEFACDYVKTKAVASIGHASAAADPLIAQQYAALSARVHASRAAVRHAARAVGQLFNDGGGDFKVVAAEVGLAKETATLTALELGSALFDLCGARAVSRGLAADRFWRNARTLSLHDGLARRRVGIGHSLLGVDEAEPSDVRVQFRL